MNYQVEINIEYNVVLKMQIYSFYTFEILKKCRSKKKFNDHFDFLHAIIAVNEGR